MENLYRTSVFFKKTILTVFTVLLLVFSGLYLVNEPLYRNLVREDNIVEWLTFTCLFLAGMASLYLAFQIRNHYGYLPWFFILFFGFNLLAGFEEISWGQRVFGIQSNEFFQKYNDQQETNLHNTFQGIFHIKTKHVALLVLFFYGVILPWLQAKGKLTDFIARTQLIIPPRFLQIPFFVGTIMMLDFQTGHEEELGEFFYSICFFTMMLWNMKVLEHSDAFAPKTTPVPVRQVYPLSEQSRKAS